MATTTPRIGLTKPDGTDLVDIAVLNTNFDKIDSNIASTKIQATKPTTANAGDLWWDSDTGTLYVYYVGASSSSWVAATSDPINIGVVANQTERDAQYPTPAQGMSVWRQDLGAQETYYGLYNASTNPGGRDSAGWYTTGRAGGLVPVKPTSAVFVTGTGTINALGQATFSGCTSIELRGVFTSEFRNYRVIGEFYKSGSNAPDQVFLKFISGTTVNNTGWGGAGYTAFNVGSSSISTYDYADNGLRMNQVYYADGSGHGLSVDIYKPAIAERSAAIGMCKGVTSLAHTYAVCGGQHGEPTAYDGLVFGITGSNISGKFQVFGYND